jgi:predicted 3-demethylubiquinone-9 3-methyltransferase (glyoxalase superfamily)
MEIATCLTFDGMAEEAMNFYLGLFPDSRVVEVLHAGKAGPVAQGGFIAGTFELLGRRFMCLNGPASSGSSLMSIFVACDDQGQVDHLWEKLSNGGKPIQCGWILDRFGVCWQIAPKQLFAMLRDEDPDRSARAMQAMLKMVKIDLAEIERAVNGK